MSDAPCRLAATPRRLSKLPAEAADPFGSEPRAQGTGAPTPGLGMQSHVVPEASRPVDARSVATVTADPWPLANDAGQDGPSFQAPPRGSVESTRGHAVDRAGRASLRNSACPGPVDRGRANPLVKDQHPRFRVGLPSPGPLGSASGGRCDSRRFTRFGFRTRAPHRRSLPRGGTARWPLTLPGSRGERSCDALEPRTLHLPPRRLWREPRPGCERVRSAFHRRREPKSSRPAHRCAGMPRIRRTGDESHARLDSPGPTRPQPRPTRGNHTASADFCSRHETRAHPPVTRYLVRRAVTLAAVARFGYERRDASFRSSPPAVSPLSSTHMAVRRPRRRRSRAPFVVVLAGGAAWSAVHSRVDRGDHHVPARTDARWLPPGSLPATRCRARRRCTPPPLGWQTTLFSRAARLPSTRPGRKRAATSTDQGGSAASPVAARCGVPVTFCETCHPRADVPRASLNNLTTEAS